MVIFYALKRINNYESIILNINNTVDTIKHQLKLIDDKGHFEADDEVGFFFDEMKLLGQELEQLFETEVDDGKEDRGAPGFLCNNITKLHNLEKSWMP